MIDDAAEVVGLGVFVEVDVGDLDDAEAVKGLGEAADGDGVGEDAEFVAGDLAGVDRDASGDDDCARSEEEGTSADPGERLLAPVIGHRFGHDS